MSNVCCKFFIFLKSSLVDSGSGVSSFFFVCIFFLIHFVPPFLKRIIVDMKSAIMFKTFE